ncbi:hypothetical protein BGZ54_002640 [Gamsiella multidivaricata]|nr:hypothetical protein BGZ54_002640 [Gamsiella multidivaricata]
MGQCRDRTPMSSYTFASISARAGPPGAPSTLSEILPRPPSAESTYRSPPSQALSLPNDMRLPSPVTSTMPSPSPSFSSPILPSATIDTPSSNSVGRRKPTRDTRGKGKGHVFTPEQKTYIAELLADPETWALLDGPDEKNNHYKPKIEVREGIAQKVNKKFSTEENLVNLDAFQIKNKIETMKKVWKRANQFLYRTGNGDLPSQTLKDNVLQICRFYYIMADVWSVPWFINPRKPCQLTGNLSRGTYDTTGDASEESDEQDAAVEEQDSNTLKDRQGSAKPAPSKKSNRRGDDHLDYIGALKDISEVATVAHDLKRRKLDMAERSFETSRLSQEAQTHMLEMQMKKMQAEMDNERITIEAEIALRKLKAEQETSRLQLKLVKAEAERAKAEVERAKAEVERMKQEADMTWLRMRNRSPPKSPSKKLPNEQ